MMLEKIPHEAPPRTHYLFLSLYLYLSHFALSPFQHICTHTIGPRTPVQDPDPDPETRTG